MYKPDEIIFRTEHYSIEHFLPIGLVPNPTYTWLQPPYAGRGEEVSDNQVAICQTVGHVYRFVLHSAIPWWFGGTPFNMENFVAAIDHGQALVRKKHNVPQLDVVVDCQGVLPIAIHCAWNPQLYRRVAFFATPMNNKTDSGGVYRGVV